MKHFAGISAAGLLLLALGACSGPAQEDTSGKNDLGNNSQIQADTDTSESGAAAADTEIPAMTASETPADTSAPSPVTADENPFSGLPAPYNQADFARGKRVFRLCSSCHVIGDGQTHRVGPDLHGIFERKIGTAEGFHYSSAASEADFDWTPEKLDAWLASPRTFLPGNRMSFSGVRKPEDRESVIAYLLLESGK